MLEAARDGESAHPIKEEEVGRFIGPSAPALGHEVRVSLWPLQVNRIEDMTTWRDFIGLLTPEQIKLLERCDRVAGCQCLTTNGTAE
jgi:hypothetical protein